MRGALAFLTVFLQAAAWAGAAPSEPGLPTWQDGERLKMEKEGWIAGAQLLTDDPPPDGESGKNQEESALEEVQPTPEELAEPVVPPNEIPEKFWPAYFGEKPKSFLTDPQGLLGATEYRDRLNFLDYHAGDSSIDLYVYVFKGDQEIPGEVREEELIERFFSEGRPAAVVFYFMAAPQLSVLYLSPSLTDSIPTSEQRRALEGSMMQAFSKLDPTSQLESFLVQMSIRLYWVERLIGGGPAMDLPIIASAPARPAKGHKDSQLADLVRPWLDRARPMALQAAVLAACLLSGIIVTWIFRRGMRYRFPEFEVEPRLGGSHAAGVGAVISFASATLPPASQKDQVPDYLRRY